MGFRTWQDFSKFSASVKRKRRFLHSESVEAFLNAVVETSTERESFLRSGTPLWRAQLGNCNEYITDDEGRNRVVEAPFSPKRMKPPIDSPQPAGRTTGSSMRRALRTGAIPAGQSITAMPGS